MKCEIYVLIYVHVHCCHGLAKTAFLYMINKKFSLFGLLTPLGSSKSHWNTVPLLFSSPHQPLTVGSMD